MLKVSIVEARNQRRLIVEGKLIPPWTSELRGASERARADLDGRALVIDIINLTAINPEGEDLLVQLMNEGVTVRWRGVFAKQVVRQLTRRARRQLQEAER